MSESFWSMEDQTKGVYAEATLLFPVILAALRTGQEVGKCTSNHRIGHSTGSRPGVGGIVRQYSSKETYLAGLKWRFQLDGPKCAEIPRIQIRAQPWENMYISTTTTSGGGRKRAIWTRKTPESCRGCALYLYKQHPNPVSRPSTSLYLPRHFHPGLQVQSMKIYLIHPTTRTNPSAPMHKHTPSPSLQHQSLSHNDPLFQTSRSTPSPSSSLTFMASTNSV